MTATDASVGASEPMSSSSFVSLSMARFSMRAMAAFAMGRTSTLTLLLIVARIVGQKNSSPRRRSRTTHGGQGRGVAAVAGLRWTKTQRSARSRHPPTTATTREKPASNLARRRRPTQFSSATAATPSPEDRAAYQTSDRRDARAKRTMPSAWGGARCFTRRAAWNCWRRSKAMTPSSSVLNWRRFGVLPSWS